MKKFLIAGMMLAAITARGDEHRMHCAEDTLKAGQLVRELREMKGSPGDRLAAAAESFTGSGEDNYYRVDSVGTLRLNLDSFSPLMLVNNAMALAKAADSPGLADWRSYAAQLENVACRRGEDKGFPSVMFHTSDWIIDNMSRGNLKELTEDFSGVVVKTKSLDEMTRYRKNFAALADSATFETVRMTEMGFRTHRIPALKKETIKKREVLDQLRNGDIIILVPNRDGIDCYDIGVVVRREDGPHLIHVSPQTGLVEETTDDLTRYFQLVTKYFQGYRILRME